MEPLEIRHIQEPQRLLLAWIPPLSNGKQNRTWRKVGEIRRENDGSSAALEYLFEDPDFKEAKSQGFEGYLAFPLTSMLHKQSVMETLMKRLPPRSRGDFFEYLKMFRIPDASLSDFALLGYTEARLPSDGFAVLHHLEDFQPPYEIVLEVAGFRHESKKQPGDLSVGMPLALKPAPHPKDENAIEVLHEKEKIGYIPRLHTRSLVGLVRQNRVTAEIERINGRAEHPIIRMFVQVQ